VDRESERRKAHEYDGCPFAGELYNIQATLTMLMVNVEILKEFIRESGYTDVYDRSVELGLFPAKCIWADGEREF
jgi:hypothetical protein